MPAPIGTDDMREFAHPIRTKTLLSEIRTLLDMLLVTFYTHVAVSNDSKITADTIPRTNTDMWIWTVFACAAAMIGKVMTEWYTGWSGVV